MRDAASKQPSSLLLWDIDHTLIKTGGVGRELFAAAFERATGVAMREMKAPAGRTETVIFRETAAAHGIDEPDTHLPAFAEALALGHEQRLDDLRARGRVLPGARAALAAVAAQSEVAQGVLTGNLRQVALIKLRAFNLEQFLDPQVSAFAEDCEQRPGLVAVARARAHQRFGRAFDGPATMLVGDTPNDVAAARAGEAAVLAVASGEFSQQQLRDAGADNVVADLTEPLLLAILLNPTTS
jgi:phosphoglycolate phosphatase-like HAD superfamily hydrolase